MPSKRNVIDYDDAFVASDTEAKEILVTTKEFVELLEQWIANKPSIAQTVRRGLFRAPSGHPER